MVIAVVAGKGGVGKSLVSLLLYESLRQAGRSVCLKDWDSQGTATKSRALFDKDTKIEVDPDITIYDTPPNLSHPATVAAMKTADLVLVVTTPSPPDIWEAHTTSQLAKELAKPRARVRVVWNKVRRTTTLGKMIEETSKTFKVPTLATSLSNRESYMHFAWQGWKALDTAGRDEALKFTIAVLGK
jgi:MinD-like ATPase involved in chromosome partitioning or flagellar assembly